VLEMSVISDLKGSSNLALLLNYYTGSVLDVGNVPLAAPAISNAPNFKRTRRGFGVSSPYNTGAVISYGVSPKLNFGATGSVWGIWVPDALYSPSTYAQWFSKGTPPIISGLNGYWIYRNNVNLYFQIADGAGAQTVTIPLTNFVVGKPVFLGFVWTGLALNAYLDGNPFSTAVQTKTPTPAGSTLYVGGYGANLTYESLAACLQLGMTAKALRADQMLSLYTEWMDSGYVLDVQHRNGVKHFIPAKNDADYVREGIVLDTDFVRQSDGKVRDLSPSGYSGTITGVPVPGKDGEGLTVATTDDVNFGNVTQLNSVTSFSIEWWQDLPAAAVPSSYVFIKYPAAANNVRMGPFGGLGTIKAMFFAVSNGGDAYGNTVVPVQRSGCKQHFVAVFDGAGVGNDGRAKIYADGENYAMGAWVGVIPAVTADLSAANLMLGLFAGNTMPGTRKGARLHTAPLTAGQVRAAYLKNFAQKLIWQAPSEDMPVSLVASYGTANPNAVGGGWQIISGTWKNSETSDSKRRRESVTAGVISIPQPNAFGTWYFRIKTAPAAVTEGYVLFVASSPGSYSVATQNGYMFYLFGTQSFLFRTSAGAPASLVASAAGQIAANTEYEVCVNRRPSDCRFTCWMRGGGFGTTWTQVWQLADTTHVTSAWMSQGCSIASYAFASHDPTIPGNPCPTRIYAGVLNPLLGEVP
jgi:hypothetical protein